MRCAACNREIPLGPGETIGFRDACEGCGADLHACRCCAHYDPGAHNDCREPGAEWVPDRERANRCEWFAPSARAGGSPGDARDAAISDLDALFKK